MLQKVAVKESYHKCSSKASFKNMCLRRLDVKVEDGCNAQREASCGLLGCDGVTAQKTTT
jgi:hypothetical protein